MKIVAGEFKGSAKHEALEIVGKTNVILRRCHFTGGTALLRFVDCSNVLVDNCIFDNALGPPDPDGQCIQFIRTTGMITNCGLKASPTTEDIVSIYADMPQTVPGIVTIHNCIFSGRGKTDSGTSICCDGPCPPRTVIDGCRFINARCAITLAGGQFHEIKGNNIFERCDTEVYTHKFYNGPFGNFTTDPKIKVLT